LPAAPQPVPPAPAEAPVAPAPGRSGALASAEAQVRYERIGTAGLAGDAADWLAAWPAWLASCRALTAPPRPHRQAWLNVCQTAQELAPQRGEQVRDFFARSMDQYQVLALEAGDPPLRDSGLMTGYYEPQLEGRRERGGAFVVPVYRLPAPVPGAPRAQLEASGALRGQELLWLQDPIEAFFLEVQGSGRVRLGPDGPWLRVAYAGSNGQPYRSIGRWLVEQGELTAQQASMASITEWARAHPARLRELLDQNPRVVFFRAQPLTGPDAGPVGTLGVPLTPGVSVAVDPRYLPLGAPLLLSARTQDASDLPLPARPVLAQDTGGAIRGPLRVDWYWGQGAAAGEIAGRQRQVGSVRLLVPHGEDPAGLL